MKENALKVRFAKSSEALNEHVKELKPLKTGDKCFIQNQTGPYPKKWHRTGTIVEVADNNQYTVKVDGSGRVTKRNRRFLRALKPAATNIMNAPGESLRPLFQETGNREIEINEDPDRAYQATPPWFVEEKRYDISEPIDIENQLAVPETNPEERNNGNESGIPHGIVEEGHNEKESQKIPAALKRLLPHNAAGQKEHMVAPEDGGRRTRRNKHTI